MNSGPYTVKKLRTDLVARALREASTYRTKTVISEVDKELGYLMSPDRPIRE